MIVPPRWVAFAIGSAFFAALTALLGKLGVSEMNSNLATFIRTLVIGIMTCGIITYRHEWQPLNIGQGSGLIFLIASGIATGASWLCYYRALQLGPASKVAPLDKLSVAMIVILSVIFLGESITWKTMLGVGFIVAGAVLVAL